MSIRGFPLAAVGCMIFTFQFCGGAEPQEPKLRPTDQARINRLVHQLGSERFNEREAASKELAATGEAALDALYKVRNSPDAEIRRRADWLISHIETGMERKELDVPPRLILRGHTMSVTCVTFLADPRTLVSGSDDGEIWLWDTATGKQRAVLQGGDGFVEAVASSPDGTTLAWAGSFGAVQLWDVGTRKPGGKVKVDNIFPRAMAIAPDRKLFISYSDGTVRVIDTAKPRKATTISRCAAGSFLALTGDGRTLAFAAEAGGLKLWDVAAGRLRGTLPGNQGAGYALAFAPDGATLAQAEGYWNHNAIFKRGPGMPKGAVGRCQVHLMDVALRKERRLLKGHTRSVNCLAFSPDGKTLVSAGADATVRLWDGTTGKPLGVLNAHSMEILSLSFSPDGRTLATGSRDKTVKLWDVARMLASEANK